MRTAVVTFFMCVLFSREIFADRTCGPATISAPSGGLAQDQIESGVCEQINSKFQIANLRGLLLEMARAHALAATGQVADYGTNMTVFSLGGGATASVSNLTFPTSQGGLSKLVEGLNSVVIPQFGTGLSASASLGFSLYTAKLRRRGILDPKRLNFYAGFLILPQRKFSDYSLAASSASFYVQYRLIRQYQLPLALMTWGGLSLGLGYTYATNRIEVASTEKLVTINFQTQGKDILYEPSGSAKLAQVAHTIPIELTSNFSILHFLSFAFGGACDVNVQTLAELEANANGQVRVDGSNGPDFAKFAARESARAETAIWRVFAGPQINIWKFRFFTLVHVTDRRSYGLTFGSRFVW
ncbi:MAG: hypothetical protein N2Z22_04440 [Turneriella sp.]|nr:hypothetical protein [Turneriella sp.]